MIYQPPFPSSDPIAVIGAGICGLAIAVTLTDAGRTVTLFDRMPVPAPNTSAIAGGMLAPFSESDVLPSSYVLAGLEGIKRWRGLLGSAHATCLSECGSLVFSHTDYPHAFSAFTTAETLAAHEGLLLRGPEIAELEPDVSTEISTAVHLPREAHILPEKALAVLFHRFLTQGGTFIQQETTPNALLGAFSHIVDCRGFVPGLDPDLVAIQGEIVTVHQPEICLSRPVRRLGGPAPFYIVPRPCGEFAIGATAIVDPNPIDWRMRVSSATDLLAFASDTVPGLKSARIVGLNSGLRAAYPNRLPEIRSRENGTVIQVNGLYRHGFLLAPVMAASVLAAITGRPDPFRSLFDGRLNLPPMPA